MGEQQQAKDANRRYIENYRNSIIAYQDDVEASNLDQEAAQENSALNTFQARREGLIARAASRADGADRGVGGLSQGAIEQALGFQEGTNVAFINRNAELDAQRGRLAGKANANNALGRINSVGTARGPSLLGLGAQLAGAAVQSYGMYSGMKADQAQTEAARSTAYYNQHRVA
jgi:hypothetical protein